MAFHIPLRPLAAWLAHPAVAAATDAAAPSALIRRHVAKCVMRRWWAADGHTAEDELLRLLTSRHAAPGVPGELQQLAMAPDSVREG